MARLLSLSPLRTSPSMGAQSTFLPACWATSFLARLPGASQLAASCGSPRAAGPVTVVLRRRPGRLSEALNPGVPSVGIRVPDCAFIRAVARAHGAALALTSANLSGGTSTVAVEEFTELWAEARPPAGCSRWQLTPAASVRSRV
jgi:hypothetical protein